MALRSALGTLAVAASLASAGAAAPGEVNTAQLNLNAVHGQRAEVRLGAGAEVYTIGAGDDGFGIFHNDRRVLSVSQAGAVRVHADSLEAESLAASGVTINGTPQWSMHSLDVFGPVTPDQAGWSNGKSTLECGGLMVLVGEKRPLEASFSKTFSGLPKHNQVRIQATVHFVDDWQSEVAYLKVGEHVVWTAGHDQRNGRGAINVCGSTTYPESRFSDTLDVSLPTSDGTLTVEFGSTLEVAASAHFGLSSLSLSLRNVPAPKEAVQAAQQAQDAQQAQNAQQTN